MSISASVVLYKNSPQEVRTALKPLLECSLQISVYVIDNSPAAIRLDPALISKTEYIKTTHNLGYGAAHNLVLKKVLSSGFKYHLVLNPDVNFSVEVVERLYDFIQNSPDAGMVMPMVCYPDGNNQNLARLLPTPGKLLIRLSQRLLPHRLVHRVNREYELHDLDLDHPVQVPSLSGCFMFLRCEALRRAGIFDERFFLYFEDYDLVRRVGSLYKTVYYPGVSITHGYARASRQNGKAFLHHVHSAVKYFNKWGWYKDKQRDEANAAMTARRFTKKC